MRIIAGAFSGRPIAAPPGRGTRPTAGRVREALFNLLASRLSFDGVTVLDLFAGSGALALEAMSRGASSATLVERHSPSLSVARANAAALGVPVQAIRADVLTFLRRPLPTPFGLAFADPPYDLAEIPALPALVRPHLADGALFALEHDNRHDFAAAPGLVLTRAYGQTVISLFGGEPGE